MLKTNETGRSMVEMLGVLAVMGVLSVSGVAMYTIAMNKHRANELLNAVSVRATALASQRMTGKALSLAGFTDNTQGTSVIDVNSSNAGAIEITITNVPLAVCKNMYNTRGDNVIEMKSGTTVLNGAGACEEGATVSIKFNNDLSKLDDDVITYGISTIDGYTGDDGSNCDSTTKLGTECQVCVQGEYVDSDVKCETGKICIDGSCTTDDKADWNYCLKNSDCKTLNPTQCGNGECFCNFDGYELDPASGPLYKLGYCTPIEEFTEDENFVGFVRGRDTDWFSAKNFCSAMGKRMASLSDFNCPYTLNEYKATATEDEAPGGVCCATKEISEIQGEGCGDWEALVDTWNQSATWSPQGTTWNSKLVTMAYEGELSDAQRYWLKDMADSENAFVVQPVYNIVTVEGRNGAASIQPLCK